MRGTLRIAGPLTAVVVLAIGVAACDDDADDDTTSTSPSFLYVQQAEQGTLQPAGGNDARSYTLTLQNAAPRTVYFSDRPDRISGSVGNEAFVRLESLFSRGDPPNAAVVISEPQSQEENVVIVELARPRYDEETRTVSYDALVTNEIPEGLRNWERHQDQSLPASFGHVSLYIDSDIDTIVAECPGISSLSNGTIAVTATDDRTGATLEGAQVQVFEAGASADPDYSGRTDASGQVSFSVTPSVALIDGDSYRVVVTVAGYVTLQQNIKVCPEETVTVNADLDPE